MHVFKYLHIIIINITPSPSLSCLEFQIFKKKYFKINKEQIYYCFSGIIYLFVLFL